MMYANKSPEAKKKHRARSTANNALRGGKLQKKPCRVCGDVNVEMHHPDYSKPLHVQWLCELHHDELHRAVPRASKVCKDCGQPKELHRVGVQSRCLACHAAYMRRSRHGMITYRGQAV